MPAEVKDLINAWLGVLVDILRLFNNEDLNKFADQLEAKLAEDAE